MAAAGYAELVGADLTLACIGLGAMAWGDGELEARLGWLLRTPAGQLPVPPDSLAMTHTLMFDDDDLRCSYSIPRRTPGEEHLVVGGMVLPYDTAVLQEVLRSKRVKYVDALNVEVRRYAEEGRVRAMDELPPLRPFLGDPSVLRLWYGFRPCRPEVFLERLPDVSTGSHPLWMIHGFGGSGWTITPGAIDTVLSQVLDAGWSGPAVEPVLL